MYLSRPPRRQASPRRVLIYLALIGAGLLLLRFQDDLRRPVTPTPTPTRASQSYVAEAEAHYEAGRLHAAIDAYIQAAALEPNRVDVLVTLSRLLALADRTEEAIQRAQRAVQIDPKSALAHAVLAMAYDWHGTRLLLHGRDYRTWCAYDAIGIPAALGADGAISTRCGVCGRAITLRLPAATSEERPERLWLAAGGTDLRVEFCTPTVLLCSPDHADAWATRQGGRGRVLDLGQAWRLGAGAWAAYAREVGRLGAA